MSNLSKFGSHKKHSKIKRSVSYPEWFNICMKLEGSVELTYVNVILLFVNEQINISDRKALLKNLSNPNLFGDHLIKTYQN